ncbi:MAG: hypothetical protein PHF21_01150 [Bacilli bacterium]|nr:hypothetical protein [Bacilli bacterium]
MKKFWEKHNLVKIAGIMVLLTALLTWVIPQGYWNQGELVIGEIKRIGIFDFFTYGLLGMHYFVVLVTFLFILGGFYQVLGKTSGYQKITTSIAKTFKKKEILFVLLTSFLIAAFTAVSTDYFVVIVFIPFIVSILSKMKLDKMTGLVTTFGAVLVGILGSIYSTKIGDFNIRFLGSELNSYLWVKLVIFASAFIIFSIFTVLQVKKTLKNKKSETVEDLFISEEVTKKTKTWPVTVVFSIFTLITIFAYLPWSSAFGVEIFNDITTWVNELTIFGAEIFNYILGSVESFGAFGEWDLFGVQILMLLASLILKCAYKINWNDYFTAFGEGFKKVGKLVIILLIVYTMLLFSYIYPVLPTIVDWVMSITSKFNVILGTIAGVVSSLVTVEYQYTILLIGEYFVQSYADFAKQLPIMLQATYGLAAFFTPASAILLVGLSYFGVSYKEWFKYIWKFLIAMFVVIVILMLIIF